MTLAELTALTKFLDGYRALIKETGVHLEAHDSGLRPVFNLKGATKRVDIELQECTNYIIVNVVAK